MSSRRSRASAARTSAEHERSSSEVPGDDSTLDGSTLADQNEQDTSRNADGDRGRDGDSRRDGNSGRYGDGDSRRSDDAAGQDSVRAAVLGVLADPEVIRQIVAAVSGAGGSTSSISSSTSTSVASDGASPLGEMPSSGEVAALGLPVVSGTEDPLVSAGACSALLPAGRRSVPWLPLVL